MMFFFILTDYINYTFEANANAAKYKYNIAFSLLRKPLKDNLYFLEKLKSEGVTFVEKFLDTPIEYYDTSKISLEDMELVNKLEKDINYYLI